MRGADRGAGEARTVTRFGTNAGEYFAPKHPAKSAGALPLSPLGTDTISVSAPPASGNIRGKAEAVERGNNFLAALLDDGAGSDGKHAPSTLPAPSEPGKVSRECNRKPGFQAERHDVHAKSGRRAARFDLRGALQRFTTNNRVAGCGWVRISKHVAPSVVVADGVAHYAGLQVCGLVWLCPVCAPKIRAARALEIDQTLAVWLDRHGAGSVQLWTFTEPHTMGEPLKELRETVRSAYRALCSGRAWMSVKKSFGLAHVIVALDVTVGPNGWHPHLHVIVLGERALTDTEMRALRSIVFQRWSDALMARGRVAPHPVHGLDMERARSRKDIGRYVCQVIGETDDDSRAWGIAQETARTDLKKSREHGHRTPWQLLEDIAARYRGAGEWTDELDAADDADRALWDEWEKGMKGVHSITMSRGLRKSVGLGELASDEALAEAEVGGVKVYDFGSRRAWHCVRVTRGAAVRVLRVAERHGERGVSRVVHLLLKLRADDPVISRMPDDGWDAQAPPGDDRTARHTFTTEAVA